MSLAVESLQMAFLRWGEKRSMSLKSLERKPEKMDMTSSPSHLLNRLIGHVVSQDPGLPDVYVRVREVQNSVDGKVSS